MAVRRIPLYQQTLGEAGLKWFYLEHDTGTGEVSVSFETSSGIPLLEQRIDLGTAFADPGTPLAKKLTALLARLVDDLDRP